MYQIEAMKDIIDKKRVLVADEMGMGKCAEAIGAKVIIEKREGRDLSTLVVCPPSVMHHWEKEIREWYPKGEDTRISKILTTTYNQDLVKAKNSDFVIVSYHTLSYYGEDISKIRELKNLGFEYGIVDEVHNAKNPESIRSSAVRELFHSMDYLALLTGTPIPNTVIDIYSSLNLLDKKAFPISSDKPRAILNSFYQLFKTDPEFVSRMFNDHLVCGTARKVEDYLHMKVPLLNVVPLNVLLKDEHRDVYLNIYENEKISPAVKLVQLRAVAQDPNLAKPGFLSPKLAKRVGAIESSVYLALDGLLEKIVDENGKILVFSDFRTNVTDYLKERWKEFNPLVIDGIKPRKIDGCESSEKLAMREFIRQKFQKDTNYKILITTTVMDEGVDLTAGTDIFHLRMPYCPSVFDQRNRRSQRIGEVEKGRVNIHPIKTLLDYISTIDEGVEKLSEEKRKINNYILNYPYSLTKSDLNETKKLKSGRSKYIQLFLEEPQKLIMDHLCSIKNRGFKRISELYENSPEEGEQFAKLYTNYWKGFYAGNTANLYAKIIKIIEELKGPKRKIDIASGPFSLSRTINEPVTNLDINPYMLYAGKLLEEREEVKTGNVALNATFHQLPIRDQLYNLALCSLALHCSKTFIIHKKRKIKERELAFREMNRILEDGGYGIITLPHTVINEGDFTIFYDSLAKLGFEVLPFSGFYRGKEDPNFKVYLAALRKLREPCRENLDENALAWKMDKEFSAIQKSTKQKKKPLVPEPKPIKKEVINEFYHTRKKESLEKLIRNTIYSSTPQTSS
ncbi:MAG: methyltransferase domain-containing protein [Nanoarchaeota archaeon]|nr:methyltransferase domain-containing protein [Nanoarchaeota archaeon]